MSAVLGDERVKHLEFLQHTIARLGTNSFLIKGWSMTLSGALVAVSSSRPTWTVVVAALMMTTGFWLLDSFYLGQERLFRSLYERASAPTENLTSVGVPDPATPAPAPVPLFTMDAERYGTPVAWRAVALSRTMLLFHGLLALIDLLVAASLVGDR
ncbi:hypothetical protein ACPEIF_12145 [Streptomyces sp. NPDC012600]|uniref:hypothetical protein n=1 Tax=Streptomyces sp. NPDC012600 TaxID=3415005 RepID=UPI003C2EF0C6